MYMVCVYIYMCVCVCVARVCNMYIHTQYICILLYNIYVIQLYVNTYYTHTQHTHIYTIYIFVHSLRQNNFFKIVPNDEFSFPLFSQFEFSPNFFYAPPNQL